MVDYIESGTPKPGIV